MRRSCYPCCALQALSATQSPALRVRQRTHPHADPSMLADSTPHHTTSPTPLTRTAGSQSLPGAEDEGSAGRTFKAAAIAAVVGDVLGGKQSRPTSVRRLARRNALAQAGELRAEHDLAVLDELVHGSQGGGGLTEAPFTSPRLCYWSLSASPHGLHALRESSFY